MQLAHDSVEIPEISNYINKILSNTTVEELYKFDHQSLDHAWRNWLTNSTHNKILGLDKFSYSCFSAGVTPAIGEFISRFPLRRIRFSKSEFVLSEILSKAYQRSKLYLEDGDLDKNDCVILSLPFSGNGSLYPNMNTLLDHADDLGIPVFVDGAYFGISHGIVYPLDRPCITDFAVSMSKYLPGKIFRCGFRFTKDPVDDSVSAGLVGSNVFDRLNSFISIKLLEQFGHNWLIDKYLPHSDAICKTNNLDPSNTITLALSNDKDNQYKRGDYYRVCISPEISQLS